MGFWNWCTQEDKRTPHKVQQQKDGSSANVCRSCGAKNKGQSPSAQRHHGKRTS